MLLAGDSYGQVVLGFDSTLPVTMDMMVMISAAVRRGAPHAFLIGDMPYLSYQINKEEAVRNAGRLLIEGGCNCIKIEVDHELADVVQALSRASIPVMAHLGLKPQSIQEIGGYRIQGARCRRGCEPDRRWPGSWNRLAPSPCSWRPSRPNPPGSSPRTPPCRSSAAAPAPHCDGHVLVLQDMLGWLGIGRGPKFAKRLY